MSILVTTVALVAAAVIVHVGGTSHVRPHGEVAEGLGFFLGTAPTLTTSAIPILVVALLVVAVLVVAILLLVAFVVAAILMVGVVGIGIIVAPDQQTMSVSTRQVRPKKKCDLRFIIVAIMAFWVLLPMSIIAAIPILVVVLAMLVVVIGIGVPLLLRMAVAIIILLMALIARHVDLISDCHHGISFLLVQRQDKTMK